MFSLLMRLRSIFLFEANAGGGTANADPGTAADPAKDKTETDPDPKAGAETKDKKDKPVFNWTPEQQAEIDRINAESRKQERKKAELEFGEKAAKARKEAEEKELAEKQEFKTLAEKRLAEVETLKGEIQTLTEAREQGEKYKAALEKHLTAQTEKLPKHIKTLLSKMDVLEQMEYLIENSKDLGVKLDSVDATPRDEHISEDQLTASQRKEIVQNVRSWT